MIKSGIVNEDNPCELLEGLVVEKMARNAPHDLAVALGHGELSRRLPPEWVPRGQSGVTTSDSEPEPDIAVVRGPQRRYAQQHPSPAETALLVEVSDSTLRRDRTTKQRVFARASIPVYWIVNLVDRQIEVYTEPSGPVEDPRYGKRQDFGENDAVPLVIDGVELARIPVRDLLP
jgi:Uma2 family endonuclease